jgi:hypothetical protein
MHACAEAAAISDGGCSNDECAISRSSDRHNHNMHAQISLLCTMSMQVIAFD